MKKHSQSLSRNSDSGFARIAESKPPSALDASEGKNHILALCSRRPQTDHRADYALNSVSRAAMVLNSRSAQPADQIRIGGNTAASESVAEALWEVACGK